MQSRFLVLCVLVLFCAVAFAKKPTGAQLEIARTEVVTACKKEYPEATKDKDFRAIFDWAEIQERGSNPQAFRKTKCFAAHEAFEKLTKLETRDEEKLY